jgi:CheY-like chemotaxis protein
MAKTIFLVDDEPIWLSVLSEALEQQHFKVISSESGEDALAKLKKTRPDLILSDVRMPVMNGFDLFERVRSEPKLKDIPYIFMSSIDDYDAKRVAKELGADDYVTKPYNTEDVKLIMSNLVDRLKL